MPQLKGLKFRVQNFRNIEDRGWVNLESVTALVGRNESGKTALLKALHKFNPATEEPYDPLKEFPRDRLRSEYQDGRDWPVCSVLFELGDKVREQLRALGDGPEPPRTVEVTRFYDGSLEYAFEPAVVDAPVSPATVLDALGAFATSARRLRPIDGYDEEALAPLRGQYANWADERRAALIPFEDSRSPEAMAELQRVVTDANNFSNPLTPR
jgi:energy-coupling factor transporter ATP-binding protein EcfA2